jgi:hypothetical protein
MNNSSLSVTQRAHAKELGNAVPDKPLLFLKPPSSIVLEPKPIEIPKGVVVHHESTHILSMLLATCCEKSLKVPKNETG